MKRPHVREETAHTPPELRWLPHSVLCYDDEGRLECVCERRSMWDALA